MNKAKPPESYAKYKGRSFCKFYGLNFGTEFYDVALANQFAIYIPALGNLW